jgi:hypothetical protein
MKVVRDPDDPAWMVKRAASGEERGRLSHEADMLGQAVHPGVVELGAVTPDDLRTRFVGGDLTTIATLGPDEVAGLGAAVATVLADLGDLGIGHGNLRAEHILLDGTGRPVLCSFGSAGEGDAANDVEALRLLLADRLPRDAPRRLARLLTERPGRRRTWTARQLAEALARSVADARLPSVGVGRPPSAPTDPSAAAPAGSPGPTTARADVASTTAELIDRHPLRLAGRPPDRPDSPGPTPPDPTPPRTAPLSRSLLMAVAAAMAALGVAAGFALWPSHPSSSRSDAAAAVRCPAADENCRPIAISDGQFVTAAGRFAIDLHPAVVVVGRWSCGSDALPAALDPDTGQVWVWDRWPGEEVLSARSVAQVAGAVSLDVVPEPSGCDELKVLRDRAAATVLSALVARA